MKKYFTVFLFFSFCLSTPCVFAEEPQEEWIKIKIPERTVIPVKILQSLKGGQVIIGQSIDFEVSRDIIIDDFIVIQRGAPAYASVTSAKKAGYVSQGGKLFLSMDYCKAVDGSKIHLKSVLGEEAEDHMGANIAVSVLLCPLALAAKGEEAEIPEGTEFKAYAEDDFFVKVLKSQELTERQVEEIERKEREERERIERERKEKEKKEKEVQDWSR